MRKIWILAVLGTAFFVVVLDSTIVYVALPVDRRRARVRARRRAVGAQRLPRDVRRAPAVRGAGGGPARPPPGVPGRASRSSPSRRWSAARRIEPAVLVGRARPAGGGRGVMAPTALSLLLTTFEPGPERNRALGVWGGIGGVGGTAGLLLGGPITQLWGGSGSSWSTCRSASCCWRRRGGCSRGTPRGRDGPRSFDVAGAATVTVVARAPRPGDHGGVVAGAGGRRRC